MPSRYHDLADLIGVSRPHGWERCSGSTHILFGLLVSVLGGPLLVLWLLEVLHGRGER